MDEMRVSPEAQQAFKLDYANKSLLLVEAHTRIARLEAEVARLRAAAMTPTPPGGEPDDPLSPVGVGSPGA